MKELSIFVDESGDFGDYAEHSSYYIISLVLHDQTIDIRNDVDWLETRLAELGYPNHCMHSGPVIRNEQEYRKDTIENRRKLLKAFMAFFRKLDIACKTIAKVCGLDFSKKFLNRSQMVSMIAGTKKIF